MKMCIRDRIIPEQKSREYWGAKGPPAPTAPERSRGGAGRNADWLRAFKGGEPTNGNFRLAGPISEAFNLGAISLRLGGTRLLWDSRTMRISNLLEAKAYLTREYRKGWELNA